MSRPLRIEFPGAWYHVMNRGLGRRSIFKSDEQRTYFLSLLADTSERYNAEWHAYCVMSNHYHLMVRTPEANLQRWYALFVAQGVDREITEFYSGGRIKPVLGKDGLRWQVLKGRSRDVDLPELRQARILPTIEQISTAVCQHFQVEEKEVWRKTRGRGSRSSVRSVTMFLCQRVGDMTLTEIAAKFQLASYASAGATIRQVRLRLAEDAAFKQDIDYILLDLIPA